MKSNAELLQLYEEHFANSSPLTASMRCHTIPFIRNPSFFGRKDILDMIDKSFREQPIRPTSMALWGAAGIGKTQIALEYSNRLWSEGFNVIIWISSETNAERAKSYSDAARQLQFSEFSEINTPEKNQHLVFQWLQRTDMPWLLVFDNVEGQADLQSYWPPVSQGRILITCRSEILAGSEVIARSFEVPPFTLSESTEMILRITEQCEAPETEVQAAREVSGELGGLALAIDITAKHIKHSRRFKSVRDFIPYLRRNPKAGYTRPKRSKGQEDYWYPHDLDNIWRIAFQNLSPYAAVLMNLICILGPESIPQYLFQPRETIEDAKDELLEASLVRINSEIGLMSVHRLLQHAYFLDMSTAARKISIHNVLVLLRSYFPTYDGANHLYSQWNRCAALHHHIQALRDKVVALNSTEPMDDGDQGLYAELIHDDIWYMIEIQHFLDAERSLLSLLENAEDDSVFATKVHRSLLGLYERTGRSIRAKSSASLKFEIVGRYSQDAGNDVANTWSNMGYTRAISMAKDVPEPKRWRQFNIDRFLRNRGRANEQLRRFEDALRDFDEAEYYQEKIHGPGSHYDGETQYERAKIEAWRDNLEKAYSLATKAHHLVSAGKPTHASVMAAQYRLGWIAMLQGENVLALQHLEKSLVISRINEQHRGNSGESARIQWRMSQVLERMGREEDAMPLREAAVKVKASLLATGDYAQVEDEDSSWDALVGLLYR
ncbi:hypothetical protein M441DRAFT_456657 [Trichoderma asperellum CBS 433.97]|uniref:Uncharacterized protein n=1 Tax=Trichoderma asperellum (strain ATCC 204424 / CBS 433.97 / NBRC 101777) TaxID=1042311 RepID=A0A2T3ZCG2_TRIA4|nr:hypothetical protein M441DRAFT_456657 [Trichoderma asperellum CBS 433.97]PTB42496.1 hypothetical protein M441DRAFT_456657 [Trichoderma asperellum CBS 433.97]